MVPEKRAETSTYCTLMFRHYHYHSTNLSLNKLKAIGLDNLGSCVTFLKNQSWDPNSSFLINVNDITSTVYCMLMISALLVGSICVLDIENMLSQVILKYVHGYICIIVSLIQYNNLFIQ